MTPRTPIARGRKRLLVALAAALVTIWLAIGCLVVGSDSQARLDEIRSNPLVGDRRGVTFPMDQLTATDPPVTRALPVPRPGSAGDAADRDPSCGTWERRVVGAPARFAPASVSLWLDGDGWHLRATPVPRGVRATVSVTGGQPVVTGRQTGSTVVVEGTTMRVLVPEGGGEGSLDFLLPCSATAIRLELAPPGAPILLGSAKVPGASPLVVRRRG